MNSEIISIALSGAMLAAAFWFWRDAKKVDEQGLKTLAEVNRVMDRINREAEPLKNQVIVMQALFEECQRSRDIIDRIDLDRKRDAEK